MKRILFAVTVPGALLAAAQEKKIVFDLSRGQFQDVFVDPSCYDYVLPEYREICRELSAEYAEVPKN